MDDFGKDVGKSWRLSRLIPAYRATPLFRLGFLNDQAAFDSHFRALHVRHKRR